MFAGGSPAECQRFITAVRRYALAAGRQRDNDWIVDLVACCVLRDALQWHAGLPPEVATDWTQLQSALLKEYSSDRFLPSSVPPAAPPASSAEIPLATAVVHSNGRMGFIKVTSQNSNLWIGNRPDDSCTDLALWDSSSRALTFRCIPSSRPHSIQFMVLKPFKAKRPGCYNKWRWCSLLGITRRFNMESEDLGSDEWSHPAAACAPCVDPIHDLFGLGETRSAVWIVADDGNIVVTWGGIELSPLIVDLNSDNIRRLIFVVDKDKYLERSTTPSYKYIPARLVFDTQPRCQHGWY